MLERGIGMGVAAGPLVEGAGGLRRAIERLGGQGEVGPRAVWMPAALKGVRPRELDRRARRDVLMHLGRHGLMVGGVDLMIPRRDWVRAETQDRAVGAALEAMGLAASWGRVPLSLTLPVERVGEDVRTELLTAADGYGVTLAIHAEQDVAALRNWLAEEDQPMLGAGLDPAMVLSQGGDPCGTAVELARWLRVARLDDYLTADGEAGGVGARCEVGSGELDVAGYRAALAVCSGLRGIVLELRGLADPWGALHRGLQAWG